MATVESPMQRLASIELGEDVVAFIGKRRQAGAAWRIIARDIYEQTGHRVDVTHETLRTWYTDATTASPAAS